MITSTNVADAVGTLSAPLHARRVVYLRDLVRELVVRDIKMRYRGSYLGVAWSLVIPLVQMLVFNFVFRSVLTVSIPNYRAYIFSGALAWTWFQSSMLMATGAMTDNRELVRRPGFPVAVLPAIPVATNLINFLLALPVLVVFIVLGGGQLTGAVLALPLVIVLQFLLTLSLAYLTATFHVTYRDTQHLLGVLLMLFFYLTPVFYDSGVIPQRYQVLYHLNPMVHLLDAYRGLFFRGEFPNMLTFSALSALTAGLLWLGYTTFTRASHRFVEEL